MITHVLVALVAFQDPLQVRAELIPASTRAGEPVAFRVTVDARGGERPNIPMPAFPLGLNVVGTSESSATSIALPGGRTITITREYVLLADQPGDYTIPALRISAGGRAAFTKELTLRVAPNAENSSSGSDARLAAHMSPDTVYVGQQSTLVGEAQMAPDLQMRLTRPPSYQAPAPAEFWIQPLDLQSQLGSIVVNGRRFNTQRFYRAYFPLTAGRFSFAPARLLYEARQGFVFAPRQFELRSNSPRLVVLPLPTEGKPADFRGAVGRFTVKSSVEPQAASVGDAVTLTVEIKGVGNIKSLPPPTLPALAQVEVLDPAESTEIDSQAMVVSGTKSFTWVLIVGRVGRIDIPAIPYSAFDPVTRRYSTEQTAPAVIEVAPAAPGGPARLGGLRAQPARNALAFTQTRGFALAQLIPLLLLMGAGALRKHKGGPPRALRRDWHDAMERAQREPEPAAAYEQLLRRALVDVTGQQIYRTGAVEELRAALAALLGIDQGTRLADLLTGLEAERFSRDALDPGERATMRARVEAVLDQLWRQLRGSSRKLVLPLLLLLQAPDQPADPRTFDAGITAYMQRDIRSAIDRFSQYAYAHPNDPSGWYNLGVAYNAQREPARAAFAFLKAAQLDPRAADVQAELQRAGIAALGQRVRPATALTEKGLLLVLSALWWLACLLAGISILRKRPLWGWLSLLPLAAAGLLVAATFIERALPPPAIVLDQGAPLMSGMNLHAETLRQLPPLTGLSVMGADQGWIRVRTTDGDEGWVREERIGRL